MREVFLGSEAVAHGALTAHELRRRHQRIFRDVYMPKLRTVSLRDRIEGAWLRSGREGVIAGVAASALHGAAWTDVDITIELIWDYARSPSGLLVRNETLADDETTRVAGLPVTTRARTAFDLGRHLDRDEAVARLDADARGAVCPRGRPAAGQALSRCPRFEGPQDRAAASRRRCRVTTGDLAAVVVYRRGVAQAHNTTPNVGAAVGSSGWRTWDGKTS
jgi:hypothetical protein